MALGLFLYDRTISTMTKITTTAATMPPMISHGFALSSPPAPWDGPPWGMT